MAFNLNGVKEWVKKLIEKLKNWLKPSTEPTNDSSSSESSESESSESGESESSETSETTQTSESTETSEETQSSQDIPVPERKGENKFVGDGTMNKYEEKQGYNNPSKKVSMQSWVKLNGWSRQDVGAHIINKGVVGTSWAFGLCVKPNQLLYSSTKGAVWADYTFKTEQWYHVRIDATKNEAKFWVNGKFIPVTHYDISDLFSANDHPLRIGGHYVPWNHATWFNGTLNGEMSDWSVSVS